MAKQIGHFLRQRLININVGLGLCVLQSVTLCEVLLCSACCQCVCVCWLHHYKLVNKPRKSRGLCVSILVCTSSPSKYKMHRRLYFLSQASWCAFQFFFVPLVLPNAISFCIKLGFWEPSMYLLQNPKYCLPPSPLPSLPFLPRDRSRSSMCVT